VHAPFSSSFTGIDGRKIKLLFYNLSNLIRILYGPAFWPTSSASPTHRPKNSRNQESDDADRKQQEEQPHGGDRSKLDNKKNDIKLAYSEAREEVARRAQEADAADRKQQEEHPHGGAREGAGRRRKDQQENFKRTNEIKDEPLEKGGRENRDLRRLRKDRPDIHKRVLAIQTALEAVSNQSQEVGNCSTNG
jgi:hypothetical protein